MFQYLDYSLTTSINFSNADQINVFTISRPIGKAKPIDLFEGQIINLSTHKVDVYTVFKDAEF